MVTALNLAQGVGGVAPGGRPEQPVLGEQALWLSGASRGWTFRAQVTPSTQDQVRTRRIQGRAGICGFREFQDVGAGVSCSGLPFLLEPRASVFRIREMGILIIIPTSSDSLRRLH